jgi:diguanylate cyclase (GGDEF)-like protein/putative nucleotidyltransferase with HDIG domain
MIWPWHVDCIVRYGGLPGTWPRLDPITQMRHFGSTKDPANAVLLDWLIVAAGVAVLGFAALGLSSLSGAGMATLAAAGFAAVIAGKYEPLTSGRINFAPRVMFAFWGLLTLGFAGGLALAALASLGSFRSLWRAPFGLASAVSRDLIASFAAGLCFYQLAGALGQVFPPRLSAATFAAGLMLAVVHYAANALLTVALCQARSSWPLRGLLTETLLPAALGYAISFTAAFFTYLVFQRFGIEIGLLLLPMILLANLGYEVHQRSLENHTREIAEASRFHLATVEALATAIDARDQVGLGHVRRTQIYAVGIGNVLGLSSEEINALRTGALLHDIGKLAVPDHILNKPGRLTPAEMEKAKIHSAVGAAILEKVGFPYPVVPTVKYHHEFWDGSGYPEGLKGNSIPLTARILMVADAFDTLRGERPYRPAISREDACSFLRAGAGTQFDPKIVSIMLRHLKDFESEIDEQGVGYKAGDDAVHQALENAEANGDTAGTDYVEQIKRANREVFTLYEMARDFTASLKLEETLDLFARKAGEFVPFDTCLVYLLTEDEKFGTVAHASGRNHAELLGKQLKVGEGATGYVLKKGKPVENVDPALDFTGMSADVNPAYLAMASLPLMADGRLIGAVSVYSRELPVYEEEHLRLLETISRIAADAIGKAVRHAETESHAFTDPMTGLPNARSLQMQFEKEVARARRSGHELQLLVMDLDGFKAVNDMHGHKAGDEMLASIGRIIKKELRDYDFLARYGGDEFIALVPETESADVIELCRRIENAVTDFRLEIAEGVFASVGASIGSACYPRHGEGFDQIVVAADKAMYSAKAFHKQRDSRLQEQMKEKARRETSPYNQPRSENPEEALEGELIVELDESHIISLTTIN